MTKNPPPRDHATSRLRKPNAVLALSYFDASSKPSNDSKRRSNEHERPTEPD